MLSSQVLNMNQTWNHIHMAKVQYNLNQNQEHQQWTLTKNFAWKIDSRHHLTLTIIQNKFSTHKWKSWEQHTWISKPTDQISKANKKYNLKIELLSNFNSNFQRKIYNYLNINCNMLKTNWNMIKNMLAFHHKKSGSISNKKFIKTSQHHQDYCQVRPLSFITNLSTIKTPPKITRNIPVETTLSSSVQNILTFEDFDVPFWFWFH